MLWFLKKYFYGSFAFQFLLFLIMNCRMEKQLKIWFNSHMSKKKKNKLSLNNKQKTAMCFKKNFISFLQAIDSRRMFGLKLANVFCALMSNSCLIVWADPISIDMHYSCFLLNGGVFFTLKLLFFLFQLF